MLKDFSSSHNCDNSHCLLRTYYLPSTVLMQLTCKILFKPSCGSIRYYYTHFLDELIEAER